MTADAYASAALDSAHATIVSAPRGDQERTLHVQCFSIGGLVSGGVLDQREAYAALLSAARSMPRYGERWTGLEKKIAPSLERGMRQPRTLSKARSQTRTKAQTPAPPIRLAPSTTTAAARTLWTEGVPILRTPACVYLTETRSLTLGDFFNDGRVLRWHVGRQSLVALFRGIADDQPRGVSLIFLDGESHKLNRKFFGPVGGAAVKLDPDEDVTHGLIVGEGVETCLAARQLGLKPVWALGSAGAISALPVLAGVEALTILAENGCVASERAVETCGSRWSAAEREVTVVRAADPQHKDVNDLVRGRATS
jgi:Toprim domain